MMTQNDLQTALQIAVFAVVFADLLTRPKMIFEFYGKWIDKLETTRPRLAYPLGYCAKCMAGQIGIAVFVFREAVRLTAFAKTVEIGSWQVNALEMCYSWVIVISCVSLTIFFAAVFSAALARLSR